jgi:predicted PurR-regulated permease PerM
MGRKLFTFAVGLFFFYVASPLILPVIMGVLFAVLLMPLQKRLEGYKFPTPLASILLTLGVTLILIVPISVTLYLGAKSAFQQLQSVRLGPVEGDWVKGILSTPVFQKFLNRIGEWYPMGTKELADTLSDLIRGITLRAADILGSLIAHLPGMAMALAVLAVSMYFFLVDGRRLVLFFRHNSFFSPQHTSHLIDTLEATCRSVLLASLVSGSAQAVFESLVVIFAGVPNVVLIGVVVFISSFIPVVGTAPVTFGLAFQQYLVGNTWGGIALLVSAILVSVMDNLIRPWFLRGAVNLHPLLAFVAAFGGLQTLGFAGVFLGPIIAALFVVTLQLLTRTKPT